MEPPPPVGIRNGITRSLSFKMVAKTLLFMLPIVLGLTLTRSLSVHPLLALRDPAPADECSNPAYDNCTFYSTCLESKYHCGPSGYPIGYGQAFCEKFSADRGELSASGQTWMIATMHCLQDALVPEATGADATATCASIEQKAFGTHAECYVQSGLCTLPPTDWLAIVNIVELKTLFNSLDALNATFTAGTDCLSFYSWVVTNGLLGSDEGAPVPS